MTNNQHQETQKTNIPFYRDERILQLIAQVVSAVLLIGILVWAVINFKEAADARNMTLTFDFLKEDNIQIIPLFFEIK